MRIIARLFLNDFKRRYMDSFLIGYNIIFPMVLILLLGYLTSGSYGKEFTGYHYYSVVMPPFCIALAIISAAYAGKDEAYKKTAIRFLFTPISKAQIVISKLLSCTLIISICNLIVLLFAWIVLRLPIGKKILPIFLLLLAETFTICAIGLLIGFGMKNFIFLKNVLNFPILAAGVLGGAFYPFGTLSTKLGVVIQLSPLTWVNRGIFQYIYDDLVGLLWKTALVSVIVGICFTTLAVIMFKKEEYIDGDLPGYEK